MRRIGDLLCNFIFSTFCDYFTLLTEIVFYILRMLSPIPQNFIIITVTLLRECGTFLLFLDNTYYWLYYVLYYIIMFFFTGVLNRKPRCGDQFSWKQCQEGQLDRWPFRPFKQATLPTNGWYPLALLRINSDEDCKNQNLKCKQEY